MRTKIKIVSIDVSRPLEAGELLTVQKGWRSTSGREHHRASALAFISNKNVTGHSYQTRASQGINIAIHITLGCEPQCLSKDSPSARTSLG